LLTVISPREVQDAVVDIIFKETSTIGVRIMEVKRKKLSREEIVVTTDCGPVKVKVSRAKGAIVNIAPEYESCKKIARKKEIPLKTIYELSQRSARKSLMP
jgi:uncharacterized protein (DUF111 family)